MVITESKFADNGALFVMTRQAVERVGGNSVATAPGWDLTVSLGKTKWGALKTTCKYS